MADREMGISSYNRRIYNFDDAGALWIDDLAKIFGLPVYAEVPPSSWAECAVIDPQAPEEYACYNWTNGISVFSLIVSREQDTSDPYFHAQLEIESFDSAPKSVYHTNIVQFIVNLVNGEVTFFAKREGGKPPTDALWISITGEYTSR